MKKIFPVTMIAAMFTPGGATEFYRELIAGVRATPTMYLSHRRSGLHIVPAAANTVLDCGRTAWNKGFASRPR